MDEIDNKYQLTDRGVTELIKLEAQVASLATLVAAQERLIKEYQEYVMILKEHIATLKH